MTKDARWVGGEPRSMAEMTAAGPALVAFIDFAQLNSVRTIPYIEEWRRRYEPEGLTVLLVQVSRFPYLADTEAIERGISELGTAAACLIDDSRAMWTEYGCEGWPSLFLWALGGSLRWVQFGEGLYEATEEAIQDELREMNVLRTLPPTMEARRSTDAAGATVIAPTEELFPAGDRAWRPEIDGDGFVVEYEAGGTHVTAEGLGTISLALDGEALGMVSIDGPGLYDLTDHTRHGHHSLEIEIEGDVSIWSVSFSTGIP